MPYSLQLPEGWAKQGWKAKIFDKERLEPPHVTILRGTQKWRINLRTGKFMDRKPSPDDLPQAVVAAVLDTLDSLSAEWDKRHPSNPVRNPDADS